MLYYEFERLFGEKREFDYGNKQYRKRFEGGNAILFYEAKKGCKNGPYFLELKGEFWFDHESEWIFHIWPFIVKASRVDVAWDYDHHSPKFLHRPKFADSRIRVDEYRQNGKRTGFIAGKLPHQYALYRKDIQCKLKKKSNNGVIWRFEVRSGGPWLKKNWIRSEGLEKFYGRVGSFAKDKFKGDFEWLSGVGESEYQNVGRRKPSLDAKQIFWENVRKKAEKRLETIKFLKMEELNS